MDDNTVNGPENDVTALEKSKHAVQFSQSFVLEPKPTFLSQINPFHSSVKSDYVLLPFQLSLKQAHDKTYRNIPIIGVQAFKGSLRRACYPSPTLGEDEIQIDDQFYGGYINPDTLNITNYIRLDGTPGTTIKGYICPIGQVCREQDNPQNNVESSDTMYYAALQVIIVASANGWSPLMYSMIDSEFFISCLFFIICIIILNFWLANLFVAVITNTFSAIRKETKTSAFGAGATEQLADEQDDGWPATDGHQVEHKNIAKVIYEYTRYFWVFLALVSLALQTTGTVNVSKVHEMVMYYGELAITLIFDLEIILRILASLPDW
ncbi:uncharacterized protein ARMOST_12208 [Armillaria ostoyae]|uniref:Ion transport domain-containing protein n=1 Tax=Armillaria ostoyae TaxID=47428 RepID=A0A284RJF2_ARMOS|nr:uncharacterized protein ARMOST_12208 [Armillaria ostoyae]